MKQGTIELIFFGFIFLTLQVWWISLTIKNGQSSKMIVSSKDSLSEKKNQLEKLLRK